MPVRARLGRQGRDAVDQLQWRKVQFVDLGTALVTARLAALFGAAVHQIIPLFTQPIQPQLAG